MSVLLYAAETWTLLAADLKTLEAFHMRCQWQISGICWIDHISNATVSSHTGLASVGEQIASHHVAIFGHIARLSEEVPVHQAVRSHVVLSLACLVGTGSAVLVDQTTDESIKFITTLATCPRRYGDQPFFMAMAQEWRNDPRWLREHDDDDDEI